MVPYGERCQGLKGVNVREYVNGDSKDLWIERKSR